MSDSAKLRFVYGLITYILSFLDLATIVVLSFLIGFDIIPSDCTVFVLLLVVALAILSTTALSNFTKLYYIGKKEK